VKGVDALDVRGMIPRGLGRLFGGELRVAGRHVEQHDAADAATVVACRVRHDEAAERGADEDARRRDVGGRKQRVELLGLIVDRASLAWKRGGRPGHGAVVGADRGALCERRDPADRGRLAGRRGRHGRCARARLGIFVVAAARGRPIASTTRVGAKRGSLMEPRYQRQSVCGQRRSCAGDGDPRSSPHG